MKDSILHYFLALALLAIFASAPFACGLVAGSAVNAALVIYFREATQEQSKRYYFDIRKGWDFWNWSRSKRLETWPPMLAVIATGAALQLFF